MLDLETVLVRMVGCWFFCQLDTSSHYLGKGTSVEEVLPSDTP